MKRIFLIDSHEYEIDIIEQNTDEIVFLLNDKKYHFSLKASLRDKMILIDNNTQSQKSFHISQHLQRSIIYHDNTMALISEKNLITSKKSSIASNQLILSPMPGKILKILVSLNDRILKNQPLIIIEAMKMEHTLRSSKDGIIKKIFCKEGDIVQGEFELLTINDNTLDGVSTS